MGKIYLVHNNESWNDYSEPIYVLSPKGYARFNAKFEEQVVKPTRDAIFDFVNGLIDENTWYSYNIQPVMLNMLMQLSSKPLCIIKDEYILVKCDCTNVLYTFMELGKKGTSWNDADLFFNSFKEWYPNTCELFFLKLRDENRIRPIIICPSDYRETLRFEDDNHYYYSIMNDFYNYFYDKTPDFGIIVYDGAKELLNHIAVRACSTITPKSRYDIREYEMDKNGVLAPNDYDPLELQRKE